MMSFKIAGACWDLELPANKLLVLLAMADHADHEGNNVFPSMDLIAWKTGYSERQVRRIVKQLEEDQILIPTKRPGRTTLYRVDIMAGVKKQPFKRNNKSDPGQNVLPPGQNVLPTPDTQMSDERSFNQLNNQKTATKVATRPKDPIFEAVKSSIFGTNDPDAKGGRIAQIAHWLNGKSQGGKSNEVGFIGTPATVEQLQSFIRWYNRKYPGIPLPRHFAKFVEHWREWASSAKPGKTTGRDFSHLGDSEEWDDDTWAEWTGGMREAQS